MLPICGQQSKIHFITFSDKVHEPWKVRVPGNPLSDAVAKENLVVYTSMKEFLIAKLRDTFVKKYPCEQKRSLRQNGSCRRPGQSQGAGPAFPLSTLGRATAEGRLVSKPEIMLLDEPLSNLDANLREEMRFEIKELQRETGVTILYVTHDQEVALAISDRMAVMDRDGRIRQIGAPDEIYENPVDSFVFRFMGLSNFIPAEIRDSRLYVKGSDIRMGIPLPQMKAGGQGLVMGCRPSDIDVSRSETETRGLIKRRVFLGPIIDYRVEVGGQEIRVQQDTEETLTGGLLFTEGEACHLQFHHVKWFDEDSLNQET
jgi:hypothetical protein